MKAAGPKGRFGSRTGVILLCQHMYILSRSFRLDVLMEPPGHSGYVSAMVLRKHVNTAKESNTVVVNPISFWRRRAPGTVLIARGLCRSTVIRSTETEQGRKSTCCTFCESGLTADIYESVQNGGYGEDVPRKPLRGYSENVNSRLDCRIGLQLRCCPLLR